MTVLTNAQASVELAQAWADFKAGTTTQAQCATAIQAVLDDYNIGNVALAQLVASLSSDLQSIISKLQVIGIKGAVATVADLPAGASTGDAYLVTDNGHGYAWTGFWLDLGAFQGPEGIPGQNLLRTTGKPAVLTGNNGDVAVDPAVGQLYVKLNDAWSNGTSLVGPQGDSAFTVWTQQTGNAGKSQTDYFTWIANAQIATVQPLVDSATASKNAAAASATQADSDATATAADRVQTGSDRAAAHADRLQADTDAANTHTDAQAAAADRVQTGADRTATGQDRTAAAASATAAANSASQARAIAGGDFQTHDAGLDALAALDGTAGLVEQTGPDAFTSHPIATATSDPDTAIPTKALVKAMLAALVGSAPSTLDTLQEIAAQLASDESVATALANTVAGKANQTDLAALSTALTTLTGNVYTKAQADSAVSTALAAYYTSSQIDAKLAALGQVKTVNGNSPDANGNVVVPVDASLTSRVTANERELNHLEMIRVVTAVAPNAVGFLDDYADQSGIDAANSTGVVFLANDVSNATPGGTDTSATIVPAMTANAPSSGAAAGYIASSTNYSAPASAYKFFDGAATTEADRVNNTGTTNHGKVVIQLPTAKACSGFALSFPTTEGNIPTGVIFSGSNDGAAWTVLQTVASGITNPGDGSKVSYTNSNVTAYSYYRWEFTGNAYDILAEISLYAAKLPISSAMTLRSVKATLKYTPARVFHYEAMKLGANAVLNTDVKGSVTRDGGTTWTQGTFALIYTRTDGYGVYELQDGTGKPGVDVSGQPSGQQVAYKITATATDRVDLAAANVRGA